jgi:hypothetical protein
MSTRKATTSAPAASGAAGLTEKQLADLEWLSEQGRNVAILCASQEPSLRTMGGDLAPLVVAEYQRRFPAVSSAEDAARAASQPSEMEVQGPKMWGKLHTRAAAFVSNPAKIAAELVWLKRFRDSIPCQACKEGWDAILRKTPPVLTSAKKYFAWTVASHNTVSAKWNKANPTLPKNAAMTVPQALAIWGPKAAS